MYLLICSTAGNVIQLVPADNLYFQLSLMYVNTKKNIVGASKQLNSFSGTPAKS